MQPVKKVLTVSLFITLTTLSGCFNFELFPDKTVVLEGRIVEAFDTTKPIDSVVVQGCIQQISLFPNWPSCDIETFTDNDGYFYISLQANDLTGRGISYRKEGYESLDSCITLSNGKMECYIKPLPTVFYVYSPYKDNIPFIYDSLAVKISSLLKDTTVYYTTRSFDNSFGGTSYYWTSGNKNSDDSFSSYTFIYVPDNSHVDIRAHYYKNLELQKIDFDTLFCKKGVGNRYKILDE